MLGVFDSGFGGLTVLQEIRRMLPEDDIVYLGDAARSPYGEKSRDLITQYTKECCTELFQEGCSLIVLACNTASAETLPHLQQEWLPTIRPRYDHPVNIIGVVRPLAEEAVRLCPHAGCIAVIGTRSTIDSGTYVTELQMQHPDVKVIQQACPLLVPLVEEGWTDKPETRRILRSYLRHIKTHNPDILIPGCTHYEALYSDIQRMMGARCHVLHSPPIIARKLQQYVERHTEYRSIGTESGRTLFRTTGNPDRFCALGSRYYGKSIDTAEQRHIGS